jgi:hypothetical protein
MNKSLIADSIRLQAKDLDPKSTRLTPRNSAAPETAES